MNVLLDGVVPVVRPHRRGAGWDAFAMDERTERFVQWCRLAHKTKKDAAECAHFLVGYEQGLRAARAKSA